MIVFAFGLVKQQFALSCRSHGLRSFHFLLWGTARLLIRHDRVMSLCHDHVYSSSSFHHARRQACSVVICFATRRVSNFVQR